MKKRIAVPVSGKNMLDAHFGHCKYFSIYDVEEKEIVSEEIIQPPPHEPGVLPGWLAQRGVTDVLAGGMGNRAIQHFNNHQVNVFVGAPALDSKTLVSGFLNESIRFSANYCDH